jgi:adenosylcobinamide-phosphate synthase
MLDIGDERLFLLVVALSLELILGVFPFFLAILPKPADLIHVVGTELEKRLNRVGRSRRVRFVRGVFVTIIILVLGIWLGNFLAHVLAKFKYGPVVEILLLMTMVDQSKTFVKARLIVKSYKKEGFEKARKTVQRLTHGRNTQLDEHGLYRAAIEHTSKAYIYNVLTPIIFYLLFGLPGLFGQRFAAGLLTAMVYPYVEDKPFGFLAARINDLLSYVPARLGSFFFSVSALFVPTASPVRALRSVTKDAGKHYNINDGWTEAALAGALNLSLGGAATL